jgi:hypothetical protein
MLHMTVPADTARVENSSKSPKVMQFQIVTTIGNNSSLNSFNSFFQALEIIKEGLHDLENKSVLRIRIQYLFDPWIRDPGWGEVRIRSRDGKFGSGIWINIPDPL